MIAAVTDLDGKSPARIAPTSLRKGSIVRPGKAPVDTPRRAMGISSVTQFASVRQTT